MTHSKILRSACVQRNRTLIIGSSRSLTYLHLGSVKKEFKVFLKSLKRHHLIRRRSSLPNINYRQLMFKMHLIILGAYQFLRNFRIQEIPKLFLTGNLILNFLIFNFRIYGIILGNVTKKELDFQKILQETFTQRKLSQIIDLVSSQKLSLINAKEIAYRIIDGETRDPQAIAESENLLETTD